MRLSQHQVQQLRTYSACDVSDALLKLKVPKAGYLPGILPYAPHPPHSPNLDNASKTIAPASTVLFVPKTASSWSDIASTLSPVSSLPNTNIPTDSHYVDLTEKGTIVVLSQPAGQACAVLGGIMATRMKTRGAEGVIVGGRVRDLRELRSLDFPVWAEATSTVGTGAEAKPWAINVPVTVAGVTVNPGDIVFADPLEGVVVIPQDKLDDVLELLPRLTQADERVLEDVRNGGSVAEAFKKHR